MNNTTLQLLEFDKIKEMLKGYAISDMGKELVDKLKPSIDINQIKGWLRETTEARNIVSRTSSIPIHSLNGIKNIVDKFGKGVVLTPKELTALNELLIECTKLKRFFQGRQDLAPVISSYASSINELDSLRKEIERCIVNGRVDNRATKELSRIRKKMGIVENRLKAKLDNIINSPAYSKYLQDRFISKRDGRYVIPVKNEYRSNIKGSVLDRSSSGSTAFIEPEGVKKLQNQLNELRMNEEKEVYKVLSLLTGIVESYQREISINIEVMAHYDFLFAKAKLSHAMNGTNVELNEDYHIKIIGGKHPLIGQSAVPLDFSIGKGYRALVITGPNTGGKTVAIKTVGLFTLMVQAGLHVPVEEGSIFSVFTDVLADIGDGQSIQESLSTFSSHIKNIISIIECAGPGTLVIFDELGSGTYPMEGMGLAVSILEEVYNKGATVLATTHHSEIKQFAQETDGFENGCMGFDVNTIKPLYKLYIGKAGESNAFLIALRLGLDKRIIERAHEVTYKEHKDYENFTGSNRFLTSSTLRNEEILYSHKEQARKAEHKKQIAKVKEKQKNIPTFKVGDCVLISNLGKTGIVCETENSRGEVGVLFQKKKLRINKKRLELYIDSKELYPEDYDFDIIFESKENRKKRHIMNKKHVKGISIEIKE